MKDGALDLKLRTASLQTSMVEHATDDMKKEVQQGGLTMKEVQTKILATESTTLDIQDTADLIQEITEQLAETADHQQDVSHQVRDQFAGIVTLADQVRDRTAEQTTIREFAKGVEQLSESSSDLSSTTEEIDRFAEEVRFYAC